jgi:phage tail-like protein
MADRIDPYKNFRFRVEIDGIQTAAFSEATIPDSTNEPIEYREGTDHPTQRKLSGLTKYGNVSLKKGLTDSLELYNWKKQVEETGAAKARKSISLVLIDEEGNDKARWNIFNAWPTKYASTGFNAKTGEVVVESLDIVHEGVTRVS